MSHLQAFEQPGKGRVLVVDGGGSKRCALLGDNIAEMAHKNGWSVSGSQQCSGWSWCRVLHFRTSFVATIPAVSMCLAHLVSHDAAELGCADVAGIQRQT